MLPTDEVLVKATILPHKVSHPPGMLCGLVPLEVDTNEYTASPSFHYVPHS